MHQVLHSWGGKVFRLVLSDKQRDQVTKGRRWIKSGDDAKQKMRKLTLG